MISNFIATISPLNPSIIADKYKVLSLNFKYVISVNHFVLGDLAIKSLFNILGGNN